MLVILAVQVCITAASPAQDVVELKMSKLNKIVIKLMFRNGSISDPQGKEGLTELTTAIVAGGGTKDMTRSQISDMIYPLAASYSGSTDKEVSVFTFEVPSVFLDQFYAVIK